MIYIRIKESSKVKTKESGLKKIIRFLFESIVPKANPDFENKIQLVAYWLLEFENENSIPNREIGLGQEGSVILKMPYKKNHGYWVDNNLTFYDFRNFEIEHITKEYFEDEWKHEPKS